MDISVALGEKQTFEFKGLTYTLTPWDNFDIQKAYIEYLKRRAYDEYFAAKANGSIPPREIASWLDTLQTNMHGGAFDWGGRIWLESMNADGHIMMLVYLDLKYTHKEVTLAEVREMFLDPAKKEEITTILQGFFADPKGRLPAQGPAQAR